MKKNIFSLLIAGAALALASCSDANGWSVEGNVEGGEGQRMALQGFNNNNWYTIDSITIGNNGRFKYESSTPSAFPEVLRLSMGSRSIYFPIDSIDHVTVNTAAETFGAPCSLSGTASAERFAKADSLINAVVAQKGESAAATDSLLKRQLTQLILDDDQLITAYYIINKNIAGKPLFDTNVPRELTVLGAVTQKFINAAPADPRTASLKAKYLAAKAATRPAAVPETTTVEVPEIGLACDIVSYDNTGKRYSLMEEAAKGKVLLLNFTSYELEQSPALNVLLANIYKKYHDRGLEIFQVAFDSNEVNWKQSAANLPWITLWNSPEDGSQNMINYNVDVIPLTYIIDRNGDLTKRVLDPTTLEAEVARLLR